MQTDVKAAYLSASGTAYAGRTRVRGCYINGTGTVEFKDGGSGGTTRITINSAGAHSLLIPESGVLFQTDLYVTLTGVTAITIFHG